jgi:hypothetical protein
MITIIFCNSCPEIRHCQPSSGIKPEFRFVIAFLDMNVGWLDSLVRIKVEPVTVLAEDRGHDVIHFRQVGQKSQDTLYWSKNPSANNSCV